MIRSVHYAFNAISLFAQGRISRHALWIALRYQPICVIGRDGAGETICPHMRRFLLADD